jgi:hypothetical protein
MAEAAPTKAPTVEAATEAPTVEGKGKGPAVEASTVEAPAVEAPTKSSNDDYFKMLDESGLAKNTKSTKVANTHSANDAKLAFIKSNVPATSEAYLRDSKRREKLHKQHEAAEKALHKEQAAITKGLDSEVTKRLKEVARAKAQDEKIAKKAEESAKRPHCATTSRKAGPRVDAAVATAFHFGKHFNTSPRHGGVQEHIIGNTVPLAKFRRQEYDTLANHGGQRLRYKDAETDEVTLHYLRCGPGSGLTGPGSRKLVCETWLADSNPSDKSRKVSNPLATAGKYTHQPWNAAYLAAKVAIYPKGADEGDLDTYLAAEAVAAAEAASNHTEGDSDDDEGSEQPSVSQKFGSKSCGQGRFKRQKL